VKRAPDVRRPGAESMRSATSNDDPRSSTSRTRNATGVTSWASLSVLSNSSTEIEMPYAFMPARTAITPGQAGATNGMPSGGSMTTRREKSASTSARLLVVATAWSG
jgi:hypothetical protein